MPPLGFSSSPRSPCGLLGESLPHIFPAAVARDARSFMQTQTTVSNLQLSLLNQSLNGFFRRYFPPSYASRNDLVPPSYGLD